MGLNKIREKIDYLNDTKQAIKQALVDKGVEVTDTDTFRDYADKIGDVGYVFGVSGQTFMGTVDKNGKLNRNTDLIEVTLNGVKDIGVYGLRMLNISAFSGNTIRVYCPDLEVISGSQACYTAFPSTTTIIDMKNLQTISGNQACFRMCVGNSYISSVDLKSLTTISGLQGCYEMFEDSSKIKSVDLSNLTTISGRQACWEMFSGTGVTSVEFPKLKNITGESCCGRMFANTPIKHIYFRALDSNSFGSYTDQFYYMLYGVTGCTVHFPYNLQNVIGNWSDVKNGFGGTNTTVLFDIIEMSDEVGGDNEQL